MNRFNNQQWSAAAWFCCGVAVMMASRRYGLGSFEQLGTGFMPFLAGVAISVFSFVGLVVETLKNRSRTGWKPVFEGLLWRKAAIVLAALYAYTLLLNRAGFLICTGLFIGFLLRAIKSQRWTVTILWTLAVTFASYLIFDIWLKAQLPKGRWGI